MGAITHAGSVVFRKNQNEVLYLVISSSNGIHWVLPKGHIESGESPEAAALRELKEETGIIGNIMSQLSRQDFDKGGERVAVQYFLIRELGSAEATEKRSLRWVNEKQAFDLLTFDDAKVMVQEATARIQQFEE